MILSRNHHNPASPIATETALRNVGDTRLDRAKNARTGDVGSRQMDRSARHLHQAHDPLSEFTLTVARDAGNSHNFAGVDRDRESIDGVEAPIVLDRQVVDDQEGLAN